MVFSISTNYFTVENDISIDNTAEPVNERNGNMYDKLATTGGTAWTAISKTITKNYNLAEVPAAVYYTEFIDGK